ncbi:MAG: hypothetical protein ACRD1T_11450, partial [Acidimicrobiia bacterium]
MKLMSRLVLIVLIASLLAIPFAPPAAAYPGGWTDPDDVSTPLDLKSGSHNDDLSIFEFVIQTYGNWPDSFADLFAWYMDTTGDGFADYGVFVYWNGYSLVGQVETPSSIIGSANVSRPASNALRVTFNRSTIGNPNGYLYQAFTWFDTNGNGIDEDNEVD